MDRDISLLVVDMSEGWEDVLKAHERGYGIDWGYSGQYERDDHLTELRIKYPHGSVRAGWNAIVEIAQEAHMLERSIYLTQYYTGWTDGEEALCYALRTLVPKDNIFEKHTLSAFKNGGLAERLEQDGCERLMIIGYDRDDCMLATTKDAVERGIEVVTSEHAMLTTDKPGRREGSLKFYRENTVFLDSIEAMLNHIRNTK